ncbi:uncharacterized protein LOC121385676 isoform X2 [Gigantopelta aegis]|uniref:uncharacterized protein LOC121385676 isoform X2 n=1 Tax=Gigantopelta aegis TaxID=1735272 RepID=UPI001B88C736|nr:uncharacterized protein LOC121385676 isoform X2 [Gigantopelta aegis]
MRSVWIYWVIAGVFTHVAYGKLSHWRNFNLDFLEDQYVTTNKMSWWKASNSGCYNGVLLSQLNIRDTIHQSMETDTNYWVGVLEVYTPWTWTEDMSMLFVINGSLNVSNYKRKTPLYNNEPYRCYKKCNQGPVGLQGKYCYCLSRGITTTSHFEDIRCPGSYDQFCGSETTMSVYDLDIPENLPFNPTNDATCGYLSGGYRWLSDNIFKLKFDKSCNSNSYYAYSENALKRHNDRCVSGLCISGEKKQWHSAMEVCSNKLLRLTTDIMEPLKILISSTLSLFRRWSKHWIGLKRQRKWKWINGTDFNSTVFGSDRLQCLSVYKTESGDIEAETQSCWSELKAICQIYKPNTTIRSTSTPSTTIKFTSTPATTQTPTFTSTRISSTENRNHPTDRTETTTSTPMITGITESQRQIGSNNGSNGMIAGVAVGIIALLVLAGVVVLIWMKRSKRFLFKSAKLDHQRRAASPVHATASVPNTYEQYDNNATNRVQYENVAYCAQPNAKTLRGPIAVSSIDYDLAAADDALQGTRHLADLPNGVRPRDVYEMAGPDDAKPETAYSADSSNYAFPGDYFELEGPGDSGPETGDYELEGPADKASDEYNTLHETQRNRNLDLNYSHIGEAELTGELYDTTEPTPHGRTDSEMYSHIKGDRFEDEDMYNHTDGSDDLPEQYDPEYNHITTK